MSNRKNSVPRSRSIRSRILSGYRIVIAIMLVLAAVSLTSLGLIYHDYRIVSRSQSNQASTQAALAKHYEWLELFNESVLEGTEFSGSLDHTSCLLGQWMAGIGEDDLQDSVIAQTLNDIQQPHQQMHSIAGDILEQSEQDRDAAYDRYIAEIKPLASQVIAGLDAISGQYQLAAEDAAASLQGLIVGTIAVSLACAASGFAAAWVYGNRSAKAIARPVAAVAEWTQALSRGTDHIDVAPELLEDNRGNEIGLMISSFQKMVESVHENVSVIRRVAQGDLTAFVNIRSDEDSLGHNLYHMVQNNDQMFANIKEIATDVALGAQHLAEASHTLADAANVQTAAVQELTSSTAETRELATHNTEQVERARSLSGSIRQDVQQSNVKMDHLVKAVGRIDDASKRISNVIKLIDDIAFQTNILALNAAVEAARAGTAGKGFAVVADEVRQLALKSADAANESKQLIEETLRATKDGSAMTDEAFATFQHIVSDLDQITNVIEEVAAASGRQTDAIDRIHAQVEVIGDSVSANASASQQTAASSQEMQLQARRLEEEMHRFSLRQRIAGQAYIPPEKQDDPDFIRQANENYQRAHGGMAAGV